jgi:Protein of unknown function (DUF2442)
MTKPKSMKPLIRYKNEAEEALKTRLLKSGEATLGIYNKDVALIFSTFVSTFTFLEEAMERIFAMLMGTDLSTASLISRKIVSTNTRIDILKTLLTKSSRNKLNRTDEIDRIICEFDRINLIRNKYVHGYWETYEDDQTYLVISKEDPFALGHLVQKKFNIADMTKAQSEVMALMTEVYAVTSRMDEPRDERVVDVRFDKHCLIVDLIDGRTISAPLAWHPRLANATPEQRANWEKSGGDYGIHWPDIDEDLSTAGLLRGTPAGKAD